MSNEISGSKGMFWARILLPVLSFAGVCYLGYVLIHPTGKHVFHEQKVRDWAFLLLSLFICITASVRLYNLITGVIIDEDAKLLKIKYLFLSVRIIYLRDIAGYGTITIKSRSSGYQGILIHLHNGEKIRLTEIDLTDCFSVELFLGDFGVKQLGQE